jgi:hypothetical protein
VTEPRRIWWARPRKLCALERPGGGGRSHRPERRAAEIEYLKQAGVRAMISLMPTRHNISAYEDAELAAIHVPVEEDLDGLLEAVEVVRRETRKPAGGPRISRAVPAVRGRASSGVRGGRLGRH